MIFYVNFGIIILYPFNILVRSYNMYHHNLYDEAAFSIFRYVGLPAVREELSVSKSGETFFQGIVSSDGMVKNIPVYSEYTGNINKGHLVKIGDFVVHVHKTDNGYVSYVYSILGIYQNVLRCCTCLVAIFENGKLVEGNHFYESYIGMAVKELQKMANF